MGKEIVLLFNIPDKSIRNDIRNLYSSLKITTKYVEKIQYLKTIGELSGLTKNTVKKPGSKVTPYSGDELPGSMIVFAGFDRTSIDRAINILKTYEKASFPYKAMMTDTNANWDVVSLFNEIKKEHESLHNS